ncbi:MAG: aminotransferase class V-fold PLP-dependent enzyme [Cyclobacteriaceae bacterium]
MSQNLFFTVGPAQLFYTIKQHLNAALNEDIGSISHRGKEFQSIFAETRQGLRALLSVPDDYEIYFVSSATEIWERIIQNLVVSSTHHFVNGSFSQRFYDFTDNYRLDSSSHTVNFGEEYSDFSVPEKAELISVTYNETSTGYVFNPNNLSALRKQNPNKLIALDVVSAVPGIPVDLNLVDTAYFSVQKCFGLPAGLGVWIVNQKCIDKAKEKEKSGLVTGSLHALSSLKSNGDKNMTPETPNVMAIYLLNKVVQDMLNKGVKNIHNETIYKAVTLYNTIEQSSVLSPFIENIENRSKTVCVAKVRDGNNALIEQMKAKNLIIGSGYGPYKSEHIRIANFPTHSKEQIEMLADLLASL